MSLVLPSFAPDDVPAAQVDVAEQAHPAAVDYGHGYEVRARVHTAQKWLPKDGRFQCPRHDSKYRPDGTFMSGHATCNMERFAIRRDGDALVVDVARWFQSDRQPADRAAARIDL